MTDVVKLEVDISELYSQRMAKLLSMLNDDKVRKNVNQIIGDTVNEYVPMKTGALRRSLRAYPDYISWGTGLKKNRAYYQYMGITYKPNIPITKNGKIVGWYSPPAKTPSAESLGMRQGEEWKGWVFGYTTPGTIPQWLTVYQGYGMKGKVNQTITWYLKRECKNRGLNV